ncbi:MAG: type II toxin-antitoxin system VapC family toxin [bacterium]|nr:type II toxin-antitoxin system VapC family toxin [bacterium]
MKYLLDTNHCSYIQQQRPEVISHLQNLPPNTEIVTSVITQGELLAGIELIADERRKQKLQEFYQQILAMTSDILTIDSQVAQSYAEIFADLRRKGTPIPTNDLWIAAIAKAYNLILVSNDEHFQHVENLQIENWTTLLLLPISPQIQPDDADKKQ